MANDKDFDLNEWLANKIVPEQKKQLPDYSNSQRNMYGLEKGAGYDPDQPQFAGIKNSLKAKDNTDEDQIAQDLAKRNALQNQPQSAPAMIAPAMPNPYTQPKPVDLGMPMQKPQVQASPGPALSNNQPLDDEDLKNLGLMPK